MSLINKIGLGTVQFGVEYGISNSYGKTSTIEVSKILNYANEVGINIIDTASAYGNSETVLGKNDLNRFKIVSKFFPSETNDTISSQFNKSIYHLKVKSLYGYLAHRPQSLIENDLEWQELLELKNDKLVDKIGYSLNFPHELKELLKKGYIPDIIQVPFNFFDHRFKKGAIFLKKKGCEIHARSTFLQGLFFKNIDELPIFFDTVKNKIEHLQLTYNDNLPSALLNYSLSQSFIDYVIIGVENKKQLVENMNRSLDIANIEGNFRVAEEILTPSNWPRLDKA